MNTGLKNKLLIMATAAGLTGFGLGCSSDAPAAEEGSSAGEETSGAEAMPAPESGGDMAAPAPDDSSSTGSDQAAPAEGGGEAAGGEGSCGEGSCS